MENQGIDSKTLLHIGSCETEYEAQKLAQPLRAQAYGTVVMFFDGKWNVYRTIRAGIASVTS